MNALRGLKRKPRTFEIQVQDLVMRVTAGEEYYEEARASALSFWEQIHAYGARNAAFRTSKRPITVPDDAPEVVREVTRIAADAGVGPMFALQGAVTDHVGRFLARSTGEISVSCGGDYFIRARKKAKITIARGDGTSDIAVVLDPAHGAQGLSTTNDPSRTGVPAGVDALAVVAGSCAVADATAASVLAILHHPNSLADALEHLRLSPGVIGGVIVRGEEIGVAGAVELAS